MLMHITKPKKILLSILLITFLLRTYNIWFPNTYVFDEVYHAFTAKEYAKGHKEAWEWWTTPPPNVAYEWTHPPLAKEVMALSILIFRSESPWVYRLPGVLFGVLSVYLVYLLSKQLFNSEIISLTSAFIFSLDGLNFVQSRTGMNDIYLVTFMLASLLFLLKRRFIISAIFLGLAFSSKWTAIYLLGIELVILLFQGYFKQILWFLVVTPLGYLLSYLPFFLLGHSLEQFKGLQQQMWWYHTKLRATHDYYSAAWTWPFNLKPVWYYVQYHQDQKISNIFASGNPFMFWTGVGVILITVYDALDLFFKKFKAVFKSAFHPNQDSHHFKILAIILLGYFGFWLPWMFSPRIMFLYHYSPSIPFLSIAMGYQLAPLYEDKKSRKLFYAILGGIILGFVIVYPMLIGIPLDKNILMLFFRTNLTKNPFG